MHTEDMWMQTLNYHMAIQSQASEVGIPLQNLIKEYILIFYFAVSPYLKTLSMVSSAKLLHLLEAFSTPWFLYAQPSNHHLVFFILEVFNNIIQYQFDGKCFILLLFVILHHSVVCNVWTGRERESHQWLSQICLSSCLLFVLFLLVGANVNCVTLVLGVQPKVVIRSLFWVLSGIN